MEVLKMIHIQKVAPENFPLVLAMLEQNGLTQAGLEDHLSNTLVAYFNHRFSGCVALEHYGSYALLRSLLLILLYRFGHRQTTGQIALDLAETLQVKQIYLLTQTAHDFFIKHFNFTDIEKAKFPPK
jgi:N-acetylglutamate synthase-like GNAT family acetyltransferase